MECVRFFDDDRTFIDSQLKCQKEQAELIVLDSCMKNSAIREYLSGRSTSYWFGMSVAFIESKYKYVFGKYSRFLNWHPNNPNITTENTLCGVINSPGIEKGYWVDDICANKHGRICSKKPNYGCQKENYGDTCSKPCSKHCAGPRRRCNPRDGHCLEGCAGGFGGDMCHTQCKNRTYGPNCQHRCSSHCFGEKKDCDPVTGMCKEGCADGFALPTCDNPCHVGTYGPKCTLTCSQHCAGRLKMCNSTDGVCTFGCVQGFSGSLCLIPTVEPFIDYNLVVVTMICAASTLVCLILAVQVLAPDIIAMNRNRYGHY